MAAISLLASQSDWLLQRNLSDEELLIHQAQLDRGQFRCGKLFEAFSSGEPSCELTPSMGSPAGRILLVGNSHADAIKTVLSELARERKVSVFMTAQNNALIGKGLSPEEVLTEARRRQADGVVLHYSVRALDIAILDRLVVLARREGMPLALLMPVPSWDDPVPDSMRERLRSGGEPPCQGMREYEAKNAALLSYLERPGHENLKVHPVTDAFLRDGCFVFSAAGRPLYYDRAHLTLSGSWILQNVLERLLDDLQRQAPSVKP